MSEESDTVLVLGTTFPRWNEDTVPKFVYDLSKEIEKNNFDTHVLVPHDAGAKRRESMDGLQVYRYPYFFPKRLQTLCYDGGVLESVKQNPLALIQIPFLICSLFLHTFWLLWHEDIDLIHSHWLVPCGFVASVTSKITDTPHVMTIHAGGVLGLQNLPGHTLITTFVYRNTDIIAPVSSHIWDNFVDMLCTDVDPSSQKFTIQPMGAHTGDYSDYDANAIKTDRGLHGTTVVLFVGRLAEKKGLEYLVEAVESLEYGPEEFQLTIVGTGPKENEIAQRVMQSPSSELITLTGWVTEEELNKWYVSADFVVVPSIEADSGDTEGMPTVIAEAFAAGNPVIASAVGGIPDVVLDGGNGYLVTQKQPEELATKMEHIIENEYQWSELSQGAQETGNQLSWEQCGKIYAGLFKKALDKNGDKFEGNR